MNEQRGHYTRLLKFHLTRTKGVLGVKESQALRGDGFRDSKQRCIEFKTVCKPVSQWKYAMGIYIYIYMFLREKGLSIAGKSTVVYICKCCLVGYGHTQNITHSARSAASALFYSSGIT